jgi:hypothetical protein
MRLGRDKSDWHKAREHKGVFDQSDPSHSGKTAGPGSSYKANGGTPSEREKLSLGHRDLLKAQTKKTAGLESPRPAVNARRAPFARARQGFYVEHATAFWL